MIRIFATLFFICLIAPLHAQKLTLSELVSLVNKPNTEQVNTFLQSKNWNYSGAKKGHTDADEITSWQITTDKNETATVSLFAFSGTPAKITYTLPNKDAFALIQKAIPVLNFKPANKKQEEDREIATLYSKNFILLAETPADNTTVPYTVTLIKKLSAYDPANGAKKDYYEDNTLAAEYTLKDGKLTGVLRTYYENGLLKLNGHYLNDVAEGRFEEYDSLGFKSMEYQMKNGLKTGLLSVFERNRLSATTNYVNGLKSGQYNEYFYDNESGDLKLKLYGQYVKDEMEGTWKIFLVEADKETPISYRNYSKGKAEGEFQETTKDSVITGNYRNGQMDGVYKIYWDMEASAMGGYAKRGIAGLKLVTEGNYTAGKRAGNWKYYDHNNTLITEGDFAEDKEIGTWRYYYPRYYNRKGTEVSYAGELYLTRTYANGTLSGKSVRFSYLEEKQFPCESGGVCYESIYHKFLETANYDNNMLNGLYEVVNPQGGVVVKGMYASNLKEGQWLEHPTGEYFSKGSYIHDKKTGTWIDTDMSGSVIRTCTYNENGLPEGEEVIYKNGRIIANNMFSNGLLTKSIEYDDKGKPLTEYTLHDFKPESFRITITNYLPNKNRETQEYTFIKQEEIDFEYFKAILKPVLNTDNCYKDGAYTLTDAKNNLLVGGTYLKEAQTGLWRYFYYDQKVKLESNYTDGKRVDETYFLIGNDSPYSGRFTYIDETAGTKEIRKIKDGLKHGNTFVKDLKTDELVRKEKYEAGVFVTNE
ncbi:hypothetical protein ACLI1A_12075 [Flavobacterium sp. RHBU_3]|uniref:toxin-antitoxin system YwqK family antitoxin n=1 Tax=Flavobacterium sp. RHBU_3 TaxID=3391184 RepID=UPI003985168E